MFVRTIGAWWPVSPFSAGRDLVRDIVVEQRPGDRVHEVWADSTEVDRGELLTWEPPARLVMTWSQTPVPTEVELSFTALGPALTRVTIEHRGWEELTDEQLAADCALPGGYNAGSIRIPADSKDLVRIGAPAGQRHPVDLESIP